MHKLARAIGALLLGSSFSSTLSAQGGLEEVIVTAEKRETTLQDTAIAVSAFTQADLERGLINNNLDIQMAVPNMLMSKGFFTTAQISIRGIGNLAVGAAADTGTGVHFNGVYLNNSRLFETEYFDTERVEVLRGPQGTLYGRNTTAGVVNVLSKQADDTLGGFIDASYGDYDYIRTRGALNVPITDNLWQRFSLFYTARDGYVDNVFTGDDIDDRDMYALRSSTTFLFGDNTEANLTIQYFDEDSNRMRGSNNYCANDPDGVLGCLPNRGKPTDQGANTNGTVGGYLLDSVSRVTGLNYPNETGLDSFRPNDLRDVNFDFTPQYEVDETIISLELSHELDGYTLHSLTGYHDSRLDARNDYDMTVNEALWPTFTTYQRGPDGPSTVNYLEQSDRSTTSPEQWSQEFRINSDFDGDVNFMAGAFYLHYESDVHFYVYSSALTLYGETFQEAEPINGRPIPEEQWVFDNFEDGYELETWAMFGELYWSLTEKMDLTVGLRYTDEQKETERRVVYLAFLDDADTLTPFESDSDEVTGKVNLNYHLSDEIMVYGTLARSYKGGGFNPISPESDLLNPELGGDPGLAFFEPEYINSVELGAKTRLLNNTLQANVTAFYYDYEDLQVSKIVNQTSLNENMDADIFGVEAEFLWSPSQHWNFMMNLSYLDSELGEFETFDPADPNQMGTVDGIFSAGNQNILFSDDCPGDTGSCPGIPVDVEGNQLPNAPEYSVYIAGSYSFFLDNGMRWDISASYYWQDEFYTRIYNTEDDLLDNWDVWNASTTLNSAEEDWYAEAWVRNIADDDHYTGQYLQDAAVGLFRSVQLLEPRTYGLTLGYRF
jgi:outer membrane receptor protein involved in Fe transport